MNDDILSVLGYYKRHIIELKEMLNSIDVSSSDLTVLATIQDCLIQRIISTERKLSKQKCLRKSLTALLGQRSNSKMRSKEIKSEVAQCDLRIGSYKFLLYVWRCFGDGVANKYVSKWNLKRLFYAHDSAEMKQSPGYLGGKKGIRSERLLMLDAISHGVPAILCDLTNVIRHGDLCLLGAADPYVIEVKSSKNSNKRTGRQVRAIDAIHRYLEDDEGEIGGVPRMQRQALSTSERHHNSSINHVINDALDGRSSRISPEEGLYYIAIPTGGLQQTLEELLEGIEEPFVFLLNQEKTGQTWGNYYPFTLSLLEPDSLYAFLRGTIYLIVAISQTSLRNRAAAVGLRLSVVMANNVGVELLNLRSDVSGGVPYIISEHFVGRLAFEFLSLDWFFENERIMIDELEEHMRQEHEN